MARNLNKPRLDQYRVGSILKFQPGKDLEYEYYLILRIDALKKNKPIRYAVHMWKVGTEEPKDIYQTPWQSAEAINQMLDNEMMSVESY
jgi:hypothetical protein